MNRSTVIVILFFFSIVGKGICFSFSVKEDTIKPIPQINKQFLISVTVFLDKKGNSNFDSTQLANTLLDVNEIYSPIKASFKICDITYVPNFQYDTLNEYFFSEMMAKYNQPNRLNMYFASNLIMKYGILKKVCGYAMLGGVEDATVAPGSSVVIQKGGCNNSITIAHELGHYFSLLHTFNGYGTELANGSNCKTAGDLICDTPGDPFYEGDPVSEYVDKNCVFFSTKKDANGQYYDPDVSNIMSYYTSCVCKRFTREQYTQMANFYMQTPSIW